jgi:hypothetical protein
MDGLKKTTREYMIYTLFFTLSMYFGTLTVNMEDYGLISAVFHILCSAAYIGGWLALARRSPETLPKYYLAGSAFRLMAAAAVLLVFCVVKRDNPEAIKWFSIVFIIFYLVMLVFDAIFFAKVSKTRK